MLTFEWTDTYLNSPTQNINKSQLDDELRKFRRGIREVMGREHDWGPGTGNTGKHKAGAIELAQFGDISARDAIVDPVPGLLFIVQSGGVSELWAYMNSAWNKVGTNDHAALANLLEDSHPQYYQNSDETIEGELDAGGNYINFDFEPAEVYNGLVTSTHLLHTHSPIGSADALALTSLGVEKLKKEFVDISATIGAGAADTLVHVAFGEPCSIPNIQVNWHSGTNGAVIKFLSSGGSDWLALYSANDFETDWYVKAVRFSRWS